PVCPARRHRGRRRYSLRRPHPLRRAIALCPQGRNRLARYPRGDRFRDACLPQAAVPARRPPCRSTARPSVRQRKGVPSRVPRPLRVMDHALPADRAQRRSTVAALRPALDRTHDPWRAHGIAIDDEPDEKGQVVRAATVFLTGGECPWQCVMCDLWQYTTTTPTPPGAIAAQVATAMRDISARGGADHIKLYNAGSFFDPRAVPDADVPAVVDATRGASRVIVESHPAL